MHGGPTADFLHPRKPLASVSLFKPQHTLFQTLRLHMRDLPIFLGPREAPRSWEAGTSICLISWGAWQDGRRQGTQPAPDASALQARPAGNAWRFMELGTLILLEETINVSLPYGGPLCLVRALDVQCRGTKGRGQSPSGFFL